MIYYILYIYIYESISSKFEFRRWVPQAPTGRNPTDLLVVHPVYGKAHGSPQPSSSAHFNFSNQHLKSLLHHIVHIDRVF